MNLEQVRVRVVRVGICSNKQECFKAASINSVHVHVPHKVR